MVCLRFAGAELRFRLGMGRAQRRGWPGEKRQPTHGCGMTFRFRPPGQDIAGRKRSIMPNRTGHPLRFAGHPSKEGRVADDPHRNEPRRPPESRNPAANGFRPNPRRLTGEGHSATRRLNSNGYSSSQERGVWFFTALLNWVRSASGIGIMPLSARYPSGPQAMALVNSARYSFMPGITSTWAFFT